MQKQLHDGLILRSLSEGHAADRENLGSFYERVFREEGDPDADTLEACTRDLISDRHPTTTLDDIWVVVDTARDEQIVSALLLIPQRWRYEEVEIGVGRIELVATHKDYRRRGLVRALMDVAHERSAELGHQMQAITGIPHYYRRFGYGMAVDLGARSAVNLDAVPALKEEDAAPKYTLRPATVRDIPNLVKWDESHARRCLLSFVRTPEIWRYELTERSRESTFWMSIQIIANQHGEDVGYVALYPAPNRPSFACFSYIVGDQASYLDTFDDVLRELKTYAEDYYRDKTDVMPTRIMFDSGLSESVEKLVRKTTSGVVRETVYAWYLRVADLPHFIHKVAPVLERRLDGSIAHRNSGELKISFLDSTGLMIKFEDGKLVGVAQIALEETDANAAFPYDSFLNILFGHRTQEEIWHILPEAVANRKGCLLLDALFPRKRSWLMALV